MSCHHINFLWFKKFRSHLCQRDPIGRFEWTWSTMIDSALVVKVCVFDVVNHTPLFE